MKAATEGTEILPMRQRISIHAAREGGDRQQGLKLPDSMISIHAAREGGDYGIVSARNILSISIHAAREGGDIQAMQAG